MLSWQQGYESVTTAALLVRLLSFTEEIYIEYMRS